MDISTTTVRELVSGHEKDTDAEGPPWDLKPFAAAIGWKSIESVRRAIRQGRIAAKKYGRYWKIPDSVAQEIFRNGVPSLAQSRERRKNQR